MKGRASLERSGLRLWLAVLCHVCLKKLREKGLERLCCQEGYSHLLRCCSREGRA